MLVRDNLVFEKDNVDRNIANIVSLYVLLDIVVRTGVGEAIFGENLWVYVRRISMIFAYCWGLRVLTIRQIFRSCVVSACVLFLFGTNIYFFPENIHYLEQIVPAFIFYCLPMFFFCMRVINPSVILIKLCNLLPVMTLLLALYYFVPHKYSGDYDMGFGYATLIPIMLSIYDFLLRGKKSAILYGLLNFFSLLIMGSRGPIVSVIVFAFLGFLIKRSSKSSVITIVMLAFGIAISIFCFSLFQEFLVENNIYVRTVDMFANDLYNDSGRSGIYEWAISEMMKHPFTGIGIGADRMISSYVHNIFLEVALDFGIVLGGILLALIAYVNFEVISKLGVDDKICLLFFMCCTIIPLMVSGSYLTDTVFWIYLGILLSYRRIASKISIDGL